MKNWLDYIVQNSKWDFVRYINNLTNNYKIFGVVEWEHINDNIYKYTEYGKFLEKAFTKVYIYDFNQKKVFFEDKKIFFDFSEKEATHLCQKDIYKITYGDSFLEYQVSGPNKSYTSKTVFLTNN